MTLFTDIADEDDPYVAGMEGKEGAFGRMSAFVV